MNQDGYSELINLLNEAKEMNKLQKDLIWESEEKDGIKPDEVVNILTETPIDEIVLKITDEGEEYIHLLWDRMYNAENTVSAEEALKQLSEKKEIPESDVILGYLKEINEYMMSLDDMKNLETEANKNIQERIDYLNSAEYEIKVQEKREIFAKELEELENSESKDYTKINKLKKQITRIDERYTLAFIFKNAPSIDNFILNFFDDKRSNYSISKYNSKCKQVGLNPMLFKYLFNIEEKVLDEKYWPFNNVFLFTCIRYIANADAYRNADQIRDIVKALHKLIYNKFSSDEFRNQLINSITSYLDKFIEAGKTEYFMDRNITWPGHPHRKEKDAAREKEAREKIYDQLMKNEYVESITEDIQNMSIEDLYAFLNKKNVEKLTKSAMIGKEKSTKYKDTDYTIFDLKNAASADENGIALASIIIDGVDTGISVEEFSDYYKKFYEENLTEEKEKSESQVIEDNLTVTDEAESVEEE